jgi:hypothetical protein
MHMHYFFVVAMLCFAAHVLFARRGRLGYRI